MLWHFGIAYNPVLLDLTLGSVIVEVVYQLGYWKNNQIITRSRVPKQKKHDMEDHILTMIEPPRWKSSHPPLLPCQRWPEWRFKSDFEALRLNRQFL